MNATPLINSCGEFRSKDEANILARLALVGIEVHQAVNGGFLATAPGFARYCGDFESLTEYAESLQGVIGTASTQAPRTPACWFPCSEAAQWG